MGNTLVVHGPFCLFAVYAFLLHFSYFCQHFSFLQIHSVRHMKAMKAMQEGLAAVRAEVKKCVAQTPMCTLILI